MDWSAGQTSCPTLPSTYTGSHDVGLAKKKSWHRVVLGPCCDEINYFCGISMEITVAYRSHLTFQRWSGPGCKGQLSESLYPPKPTGWPVWTWQTAADRTRTWAAFATENRDHNREELMLISLSWWQNVIVLLVCPSWICFQTVGGKPWVSLTFLWPPQYPPEVQTQISCFSLCLW